MSQTSIWNIVQALSAFKSQRRRHANYEEAMRQIKCFPPHLLADVSRPAEAAPSGAAEGIASSHGGFGSRPAYVEPSSLKAMIHMVTATSVSSIRQDDGFEKIGRSHAAPYPRAKKNRKEPVTAPAANDACCPG